LIGDNQNLFTELYFNHYTERHFHEIQSVTKSIQSLLLGIALDKGFITDIHAPIQSYFKDYPQIDWSNGKENISIFHLLTMQAGLEWNEGVVEYAKTHINDASLQMNSQDIVLFALLKKMQNPNNNQFIYSSANPILISKIIKETTKMGNEEFAQKYLFNPLNIKYFEYEEDYTNPDITADLYMLPRDMFKIGQLLLNEGKWNDKSLISTNWLQQSWTQYIPYLEQYQAAYGFMWWLKDFEYKNQKLTSQYAWGIGGQHIFLFKDLNLTIIFTGSDYSVRVPQAPFRVLEMILANL
jgi:CubicO group peptidase (beta-lactamase class C family)